MMILEIANPSDQATLEAENPATAHVACLLLSTAYGLIPCGDSTQDDDWAMPPFIFGGADDWFKEKHGVLPEEYLKNNPLEVAECLESVLLCGPNERVDFHEAMAAIDDPWKRQLFKKKWLDRRRSSLNDFSAYACRLAEGLRNGQIRQEDGQGPIISVT